MGKTPKPLSLLVSKELYDGYKEEFERLSSQGHSIDVLPMGEYDVILGSNMWRMQDMEMLPVTLKAARKARYG